MASTSRKTKHADVAGFCSETMKSRIDSMQKYKGEWRRIDKKTIVATCLIQQWTHVSGETIRCSHFSPWGMKEFVQKTLANQNNKKFHVLPPKVRQSKFCSSKDVYVASDWEISISNTGPQEPKSYNRVYCTHCNSVLLPKLLDKHRDDLGVQKPDLVHLIANWDILKIPDSLVEYVGCFLPWDKNVISGPNSRHFICEPCDHAKTTHP